ncbi:DUF397 domain-containing protein [Streptomyces griseofuscus]|uniref:DUF397 domain-containing protein n=1 Tax=Streptomyces griseofuscus TaxID=146922 RepID=UPI0033C30511
MSAPSPGPPSPPRSDEQQTRRPHRRDLKRTARPPARRAMSAEALQWFKSTYSGSEGGQCVEVASCAHSILVRDSKQDPSEAPTLHVSPLTWAVFTSAVR